MGEDEWTQAAMTDDSMVVELLMRLNQSEPVKMETRLQWGVRQPRSRQVLRCNIVQVKKEDDLTRASPTTPLSWSGGTSVSGGGGEEALSQPIKRPNGVRRSKVNGTSETTKRRSRKKKTLSELKEEENLLLKDRMLLKKELASLRIVCEEQRARNKNLKRMKFDLQSQSAKQKSTIELSKEAFSDQSDRTCKILPINRSIDLVCSSSSQPCSFEEENKDDIATQESFFALPDLNLPFEDDCGSEILYGMS